MTSQISNQKLNRADIAGIVLVCTIWGERLLYYVRSVLLRIPGIREVAMSFITVAIIGVIFFTIEPLKKRFKIADFVVYFSIMLVYLLHSVIYNPNEEYLSNLMPSFLFTVLPMYLLGVVCDIDKTIRYLGWVSFAYIILGVAYYYYTISAGIVEQEENGENMGLAYMFLPHTILLLYGVLRKFNVYWAIGAFLGIFIIFGSGNRGTLLIVFLFLLMYLTILDLGFRKRLSFWKLALIALTVVLVVFIVPVSEWISEQLTVFGMSTRAFDYIINGEFTDDNGREAIISSLREQIYQGPVLGYGLCGDRVLIGGSGAYSHNLFIELLVSFGPLLGFALFGIIIYIIYKGFVGCTTVNQRGFLLLLFCCGFIKLFISNSFLEDGYLFFLLGFCSGVIRNKEKDELKTAVTARS